MSFRAAQAYGPAGARASSTKQVQQQATGRVVNGRIVPPFSQMSVAEAAASTRRDVVTLVAGQVDSPVNQGEGFDQPVSSPRSNANPSGNLASGNLASGNLASGNLASGNLASGNLASGNFSMYSRAADRVEVATAVTLGRSLDARA